MRLVLYCEFRYRYVSTLGNNPEEIKRASYILQEGAVDGKPTINIKDFYKKFENVSDIYASMY